MDNETRAEKLAKEKASGLGIELMPLKEAFKEMRRRMIDGWTMCQQACPISGFPLVKKNNVVWSIRCNCEITDPDAAKGAPTLRLPGSLGTAGAATKSQSTTVSPKKKLAGTPSRRNAMDRQSKLISEKLLQGWKMLKAVCPITSECPLLEDKAGRQWSAAINMYVDEYANQEDHSPQVEVPPPSSSPSPSKGDATSDEPAPENDQVPNDWKPPTAQEEVELREKQKRSDEMSKKMGSMLLAGWKMLEEVCPITGEVPLMMDKEGKKFSVAVNAFVGGDSVPALPATVASAAPVASEVTSRPQQLPAAAPSIEAQEREFLQAISNKVSNVESESISTIESSMATMRIKLADITDELSICEDAKDIQFLAGVVDSCARSLTALAAAKKSMRELQ